LKNSPPAIDLVTALGRLLSNGALRDALADDASLVATNINLRREDQPALLQLVPDELEFQACVLLRKRLEGVRKLAPQTCDALGDELWSVFHRYARNRPPSGEYSVVRDAYGFCHFLETIPLKTGCASELNRLRFVLNRKRLAIHCLRRTKQNQQVAPAVQLLLRHRSGGWKEFLFGFRL
jgi:hypothetical protein